jgi:chaperonin GroEL
MTKKFSLFEELESNISIISDIDDAVKITLGPTGKTGIIANKKGELSFITSGSSLVKSLEFESLSGNVLLKLFEQAAIKTSSVSGDGSTTTILLACEIIKTALKFLVNGYNGILLSNGLKKLAYFLVDKSLEFSVPINDSSYLVGILKTGLGKKINVELFNLLKECISKIGRDGLILIEENITSKNEVDLIKGVELDRGFASSYFVNDVKNFEVNYENPYILIANSPINSINQIRDIVEFVKGNNKPLVIIAEEINKDIVSTLVLNNIQKKLKVVVIKYKTISFIKNGLLEDLATLTYSNYFLSNLKKNETIFKVEDLGQAEKVIVKKDKTTFIISKFVKLIAKRRINELNRELLNCETEYEKSIFKTRIARLSGNIAKIKIGLSNQYQIEEERQKVEKAINTIKSSLEEGVLPGGGIFYLHLRESIINWANLNLIGDEFFASQIVSTCLGRPFEELMNNTNHSVYLIKEEIKKYGYPNGYDVITKKFVNAFESGLLDSAKSIRSALWNSITIVSTLITSD